MTEYVQLPNGNYFPLKEGENAREALMEARKLYPDAFGTREEIAPVRPPKEGLLSDFAASAKNLLGISKTGIGALTGDTTQAALEGKRRQEKLSEEYKSGFNPQAIADKFNQGQYLGAAGEALSQVPSAVASIAPSVGQEIGLAATGRIAGGALGSLGGPGGTLVGQQVGQYALPVIVNFIQALGSQAQEKVKAQVEAGEKPDVNALELAPYAATNAALNLVGTKIAMPGVFKKAIGQKVAGETADETRKALLAEAGKIAGRGTLNTIGRGIGGFALGELPTEVLQDVVDRAAIGKPLADDAALKQYRDTTFNMLLASPLGGGFGVQQRAGARQTVAKDEAEKQALQTAEQRKQAETKAQQEAAAEAARKQSPEYAQEVKIKYDETFGQFKQLQDAVKAFGKNLDPVAKEERILAEKELKAFVKESMQPIAQEYAAIKKTGVYDRLAEQQRVAGLTPMDYMLENAGEVPNTKTKPAPMPTPYGIQPTSPELARFKGTQQQAIDFARNQITAANDQRLTDQKAPAEQVADYTQYLLTQPKQAAYLATNRMRLPGLSAKQNDAVLENVLLALNMGRAAGKYDASFNPTTLEQKLSSQPATTTLGAEAEEQGILEQTEQEKAAAAQEAARQEKVRPEQYALQQMQQKAGRSVMGLPGFGTEKETPTPSPAIGQMQQQLQGIPFGEGLLPTAEDVDTTPPKVQKGPGGGFRLFNERGERQLTDEQAYRSLSERLANAAANPDLSDEAYDFLRRAETALPKVNTRLQETRQERVKYGQGPLAKTSVARDVAEGESFYKLLDEQLARIERGEEGVYRGQRYLTQDTGRVSGTGAEITSPTEAMPYDIERNKQATPSDLRAKQRIAAGRKTFPNNLPFEQPAETERQGVNVPGAPRQNVVRATSSNTLRGKAPALSLREQLEPLIRQQEQVQGEGPLARGQGELFAEEGANLGYAKMNRAGFVAFMKSKVVQKMRDAINKDKTVLAKAKNLPALKAKVASLSKQLETMQSKNLEYSKAASILQHARGMDKLGKDRAEANAALMDMEINRTQLAGRIEELMQLRGAFDQQVEKYGDFKNTELANRFEPLLSEYTTVQQELATLNIDLATLDAGMKQLDNELRVEKARNALARLNPETVSKEAIAQAQETLRAAQVEAGVTEAEASKVEQQTKQRQAQEAREAEAVRLAESEKQRIDLGKERQRRLEAAYGTSSTGQEYEFITVAQRMSQEMEPVETTVKRGKRVLSNPNQVLAGYRSRITAIEKQMIAAFNKSRDARDSFLVGLADNVAKLNKQYRDAKGSEERAALLPAVENAEKLYDNATLRQQGKDDELVWKGKSGQLKALAKAYNDAETLEADINEGRIVQPEEFKRKSPKINLNKGEKEARAEGARPAEVAEAKQRATAPETSGEKGVTRMVATKARKPTKTVYSSKGLGQEGLSAEKEESVKRAKEKQAEGKPLNPFDQRVLAEARQGASTTKGMSLPVQTDEKVDIEAILRDIDKEGLGTTYATTNVTQANPLVKDSIEKGRFTSAINNLAKDAASSLLRDSARNVLPYIKNVKVKVQPNLTLRGESVPALYDPASNTVYFDPDGITEENIVHESIHAATKGVWASPEDTLTPQQLAAKREIENIFADADIKKRLEGQYALKDAEEFMSEMQSNEKLRTQFDSQPWYKRLWGAIMRLVGFPTNETTSKHVTDLIEQLYTPATERAGEAVGAKPMYNSEDAFTAFANRVVAQPKTFRERMGSNLALEAEMQLVDMRAGLREALKAGATAMGDIKLFTQSMYNVLKADQSMPLVSAVLSDGALEIYTDAQGLRGIRSTNKNSAKEVFDAITKVPAKNEQGRMALATTYMIAQRAANKGLTALDLGALGVTEKELKEALAAADADPVMKKALEEVRAKYNAYNEGQIRFLAASGSIPRKLADDLLKEGDYVPYYRVLDDGTAQLVYGGEKTITIGDIRHQPYLQELKGGDTKILPLNESIPRNTMLLTKKALTNLATKEIAYAMQAFGEGKGEVDPKTGKAKNLMSIHSGRNPSGSNVIVFNQEPDPKDPKDDGQRWLRVDTKGTAMEGIPTELVVQSLEGSHLTLPAFLKIGGYAGDLLRKGVTRMPPYILRQLYRDPMAAAFTSGLNYNPLTAVLKAGKEFIAMNRGESKTGAELIRKGLIQSGIFTGDPSDISAFALQLASGKDQSTLDKLLAMTDRAAMRADASTRALVYDNALANGLSEVEADMMVMESMNFYKRGLSPTVQYANRLIPFMNAQIQGLNVLYKAATGKMPFNERQEIQRKFFNNAMMLAATGVVYAMAMEDDKYFRNAKPKEKYSNFFMHLPGVEEPLKLAIPYEAGWFFSAGVAVVDAMKAETDGKQQFKAVRDMFLNAVPGYSSLYMPQAVKPLFEVWSNKNFFSGYNIESPTMQNKRIEDRYLSSTTEAAKALSRMLPILSPIQIEHITRAYFGALPLAVMAGTGDLFAKPSTLEKPEARITDVPIIGSMFQKEFGGADADVVYNLAKDAIQTQASFSALKKSGNFQDVKDFAQDHRAELVVAPMAKMFQTNMNRLRTQEDIVVNRLNLSPAEKRVRIDAIEKARQDMSSTFMQRIKQAEERVGETIPQ